jgi:hypothetical protein
MPSIISTEQRGFIKGREIKDCICLTSEGINLLHRGNLALKVDIAKAFDTLDALQQICHIPTDIFLVTVKKSAGIVQVIRGYSNLIKNSHKNKNKI